MPLHHRPIVSVVASENLSHIFVVCFCIGLADHLFMTLLRCRRLLPSCACGHPTLSPHVIYLLIFFCVVNIVLSKGGRCNSIMQREINSYTEERGKPIEQYTDPYPTDLFRELVVAYCALKPRASDGSREGYLPIFPQ